MKRVLLAVVIMLCLVTIPTFAETVYTPTTETTCNNGICETTLYSGTRFVFEDNQWKTIEKAKSLKGVWSVEYVEKDVNYNLVVLDYNYTSITFRVNIMDNKIKDTNISVKLLKDEFNETKIKELNVTKEIVKEEAYSFKDTLDKKQLAYSVNGSILGYELHFGPNSTIITLNESNGGNVGDTTLSQQYPTINYGTSTSLTIKSLANNNYRLITLWNLSFLKQEYTILDANISLFLWYADTRNLNAYNTSLLLSNETTNWTEKNVAWNSRPTEDTLQQSISSGSTTNVRKYWNVTNAVISTSNNANKNMSIDIRDDVEDGSGGMNQFVSKENSSATYRPQLVIKYKVGTNNWYTNESSIVTEFNPNSPSLFNITWNNTNISIDKALLEVNLTSGARNYTMTNATFGGNISNLSVVLPAGSFCWKSFANDTNNDWNSTDSWCFTIDKNTTNPITLDMSSDHFVTNSTNSNLSSYTTNLICIASRPTYSQSGPGIVITNGIPHTSPYCDSYPSGTTFVNFSVGGNENYTSNTSSVLYYLILTTPTISTGGGGGGSYVNETHIVYGSCGDGICNAGIGENIQVCSLDCKPYELGSFTMSMLAIVILFSTYIIYSETYGKKHDMVF